MAGSFLSLIGEGGIDLLLSLEFTNACDGFIPPTRLDSWDYEQVKVTLFFGKEWVPNKSTIW
jgi:hypothetical protein